MSEIPLVLCELHRLHLQLGDVRERYERGPRQLQARQTNVARLEGELNDSRQAVKQARMTVDQKELTLKSGEAKLKDLNTKLNVCKSNREYQAILDQIAADKMAGSVLSDEILEGLEKVDQLKQETVAAEQRLTQAKTEMGQCRDKVAAEAEGLVAEIRRLEAELQASEAKLPRDFREAYERVVRSKGSDGMAPIEAESCGGCNRNLTPNMMNTLLLGQIVFCGSCGRLLYLPESRILRRRES